MSRDEQVAASCPHCGHALAETNRGWWWCSRCERRMRLPKTGGETGTGKPAFHLASSTPSAASPLVLLRRVEPFLWNVESPEGDVLSVHVTEAQARAWWGLSPEEPLDVSGMDSHDPADALIEEGRFDG